MHPAREEPLPATEHDRIDQQVDLVHEVEPDELSAYVAQEARAFRLGSPREVPFTLGQPAPSLGPDAPGSAGARVGAVIMATVFGMALGGWMSGAIFDLTGSYRAAFVNGIFWNLLNLSIAIFLLRRPGRRPVMA